MEITKIKKNGIIMPTEMPLHVRCGQCEHTIIKANEPKGELSMFEGLPICSRCRIIKVSKFSDEIQHSKEYKKDSEIRNDILQKKANDDVVEVAIKSQQDTNTTIIK